MRRIVPSLMMACLLLHVGCDNTEVQIDEAADNANAESTSPPPTEVSPLELMPDASEAPDEPAVEFAFEIPDDNAAHPIAGRSAFPEQDEDFQQPIAAKRLSEEDPFAIKIDPADIPEIVPWDQAKRYVGYEITVAGKIVSVGQTRDASVNFLNFHKDYRGKFYMVIFEDLAETLDKSVEQTFLNKTVRVQGMVENHRGNPQIKILSMDQVEFVGE